MKDIYSSEDVKSQRNSEARDKIPVQHKNNMSEGNKQLLGFNNSEVLENTETGKINFFGLKNDVAINNSLANLSKTESLYDIQISNAVNLPVNHKNYTTRESNKEKKYVNPKKSEKNLSKLINTSNDSDSHCKKHIISSDQNKSKTKENKKTPSQVKEYLPRRRFNSDFLLLNKVKPNKI